VFFHTNPEGVPYTPGADLATALLQPEASGRAVEGPTGDVGIEVMKPLRGLRGEGAWAVPGWRFADPGLCSGIPSGFFAMALTLGFGMEPRCGSLTFCLLWPRFSRNLKMPG